VNETVAYGDRMIAGGLIHGIYQFPILLNDRQRALVTVIKSLRRGYGFGHRKTLTAVFGQRFFQQFPLVLQLSGILSDHERTAAAVFLLWAQTLLTVFGTLADLYQPGAIIIAIAFQLVAFHNFPAQRSHDKNRFLMIETNSFTVDAHSADRNLHSFIILHLLTKQHLQQFDI
jgi:hypothetical protein